MSDLNTLASKLAARAPAQKHMARKAFIESFALINKCLSESIPIKAIVEDFNSSYGMDVSLARFRQMLREQRKVHNATTSEIDSDMEAAE